MLSTTNSLIILFSIFPLAIITGNLSINTSIILISLIFLISSIIKISLLKGQKKIFLLLGFFFTSLLINLLFSNNFGLSSPRVIKFFFIIFFIVSFRFLVLNLEKNQINKIYKIWSIIFTIIIIDLIIEFFKGTNIIGLSSQMPGWRLASFTGMESVIGNYFYGFALITLAYFYQNISNKKYLNLLLAIFFIIISLIIGERANFIKTFIIIICFIFLVYDFSLRSKIFSIVALISLVFIFINFNSSYKNRYFSTHLLTILEKNGLSNYLQTSQYGAQYNVAIEIFKDNPVFGVGIKNYRIENLNSKYNDLKHKENRLRWGTHPHQIHLEILSETGLFGYSCFFIFVSLSIFFSIKSYLINKNIYQLSGILFVLTSMLPLLPSGSFLSTYTSSIFWINYAIMIAYIKD